MEKTLWLETPVRKPSTALKIPCDLKVEPYYGRAIEKRLWHTQYTIGSASSCDLVLDDPFVSKHHAELYLTEKNQYAIRSLNNRNGIFVNGTRVNDAYLSLGAVIKIGRSFLRFSKSFDPSKQDQKIFYVSNSFKEIIQEAKIAAKSNFSVLITGETGTGKEVVAKLIHENSFRASAPFISVNCASLSGDLVNSELFGHQKGAFTGAAKNRVGAILSAHRGTLFLDEFGDLPLPTQALLLRVLETKEVKALGSDEYQKSDFRLVTATSLSIETALAAKKLRSDLFYRIADNWIHIPPLRDRKPDIKAFVEGVLHKEQFQIEAEAKAILRQHNWSGNVRELNSVLNRAITRVKVRGTSIVLESDIHLHGHGTELASTTNPKFHSIRKMEEWMIRESLRRNAGQRKQVARELGIARSTLFQKLRKYKIQ